MASLVILMSGLPEVGSPQQFPQPASDITVVLRDSLDSVPWPDHVVRQAPDQEQGARLGTGLALGALLGSASGFIGGTVIGYQVERRWYWCECDDPGLSGALLGSLLGPVLVTPIAAHLANGRRGSVLLSYGAAAVIGGIGFLGLRSTLDSSGGIVFLLGTPVAQAIGAMLIEHVTGR